MDDNEEGRLREQSDIQGLDTAPDEAFDVLAQLAARCVHAPMVLICLISGDHRWVKACVGLPGWAGTPSDLAFCAQTVLSGQVAEVPDTLLDERFRACAFVLGQPHVRHCASVPVVRGDGLVLGSLCVIDLQPRRLTECQWDSLQMLALLAARLLESRRSERRLGEALAAARSAEAEAQTQRRRLELTIEGTQAVTWEIDLRKGQLRHDSRWRETFGHVERDLGGDVPAGWVRGIHPADRDHACRALEQHLQGHSPAYVAEVRRKGSDDHWRWVEERGRIGGLDGDQMPSTLYGVTLDVSERKRAQQALQLERDLFAAGPCAVLTWSGGASWSVRTATSNVMDLLGFGATELMADRPSFASLAHPEDQPTLEAAAQALRADAPRQLRLRFLHAHGHYRHMTLVVRALEPDAQAEGLTIGYLLDSSDAAEVEARVLHHEQQLQAMVDSTLDAIISVDSAQRIVLFNPAATRIFGYSREEALGMPLETLIPERSHQRHRHQVTAFAKGSDVAREMGDWRGVTGRRKDGSEFPVEASVSRSGAAGAEIYTAVLRDATDRQRAHAATQAAQRAENASQAKSELLSRVSHELREPLNAVLGYAGLMLMDTQDTLAERHRQQVQYIRQSGAHLLNLIDDLLNLARIEHGDTPLQRTAVNLGEAVRSALDLLAPGASELGLRLVFEPAPDQAWVLGDRRGVAQVLLNVISNAVKYNRPGGSVQVGCRRSGDDWELAVKDSGMGISSENLGGLFEPFNRLGAQYGNRKGTGLGLVICRDLLRKMEGRMSMESVEGEGSTVRFQLRACAPPAAGTVLSPACQQVPVRHRCGGGRLLYIEDDEVNIAILQELVTRQTNWQLTVARSGQEGIDIARRLRPDAVVTDMNLPDLHGLDVIRQLRQLEDTRHCLIVALSADAVEAQSRRALDAGANEYWTKPLDLAYAIGWLNGHGRSTGSGL